MLLRLDHVASRIVTGINGLKKQAWADLFVTLGFGSLSQIAMSSALRVFTRGMFGFAEIIVVVTLVYLLAAEDLPPLGLSPPPDPHLSESTQWGKRKAEQ